VFACEEAVPTEGVHTIVIVVIVVSTAYNSKAYTTLVHASIYGLSTAFG
jgi:hypothetical protein